jgi:hypothetical protein
VVGVVIQRPYIRHVYVPRAPPTAGSRL